MLQTILGCDINELSGKDIVAVREDYIIRAIGYQGLYIPLYYKDNKKIFSERELCELLNCFKIIENGYHIRYQISSHEISTEHTSTKGRK